jgi:hypothetical protein
MYGINIEILSIFWKRMLFLEFRRVVYRATYIKKKKKL